MAIFDNPKVKKLVRLAVISIVAVIFMLFVIEAAFQVRENRKTVLASGMLRCDRLQEVLEENSLVLDELQKEVETDALESARGISIIIEGNPALLEDSKQLAVIADKVGVDEVNIFDKEGVIFAGNVPAYFGVTMNDGKQLSEFLPMLEDINLELCQEVQPNTINKKDMLYAACWNSTADYIVQVGIEPVRITNALENSDISAVIAHGAPGEGSIVMVSSLKTGKIEGSSRPEMVGTFISEYGITMIKPENELFTSRVDGDKYYTILRHTDYYDIEILERVDSVNGKIPVILLIVFLYLCAGMFVIYTITKKTNSAVRKAIDDESVGNKTSFDRLRRQLAIVEAICSDSSEIIVLDLEHDTAKMIKSNGKMLSITEAIQSIPRPYNETWNKYIEKFVFEDDARLVREMVRKESVLTRFANSNEFLCTYRVKLDDKLMYFQLKFSKVSVEDQEDIVVCSIKNIDEIINSEIRIERYGKDETLDILTGFTNRKGYEDALATFPAIPPEEDFTYISLDVNELKNINDVRGHAAGDEVIKGAAECAKRSMGSYGKIYRIGGDEFAAIIFANAEKTELIKKDFYEELSNWKGKLNSSITVAMGIASKREFPSSSVVEMAKIAEQRMAREKAYYYEHKSIDREGRQLAYEALSNLYDKILKIDLNNDSYNIIKMDEKEKSPEYGFALCYSDWVKNFAELGFVHPEDKTNFLEKTDLYYLRRFLDEGNRLIEIKYRRKEGENFVRVRLEMTPTPEYTNNKQFVYCYIKKDE